MFKFITNRPFWVNLLVAALLTFAIIYFTLKMLGIITKHGEYLKVPAVLGKKTPDAVKQLQAAGFDVQIQDSTYTDTLPAGVIIKQLPDGNATVKVNRSVYLVVNRVVPPMIEMPKLEGQSLTFALALLERNHLKLEDTIFKPDFQIGTVLEQQLNGKKISDKTKVQWGSKILLVVGNGLGKEQFLVPTITGKTFSEARDFLQEYGLSFAAINADANVKDTLNAYVYKQSPERFDEEQQPIYIRAGQVIDVWLSKEPRAARDTVVNTIKSKEK
jgi:eukaryotic-like serine/threonine-protein kinase